MRHQTNQVRRTLRSYLGYRILWEARLASKSGKATSYGLRGLDQKLISRIDTSPNYYVEIGANDGRTHSNTLVLELYYGWTGLLIEPMESSFKKLKRNRSKRRNVLLRAACVSEIYPHPTLGLVWGNLSSTAVGLDTDIPDPVAHAGAPRKDALPDEPLRIEDVPAMTMTRALENAGAPTEIGLLSLDVEGAELEVLQGIDFDKYRFDWMLIESRDVKRVASFLENYDYFAVEKLTHHDYLFSRVSG